MAHCVAGKIAGVFVLAVALSLAGISCKEKTLPAAWSTDGITIDGNMGDWNDLPTRYLKDHEAVAGIANDSANVYLMLRFRDRGMAGAIRRAGLTVWIDPTGGSDEIFMVKLQGFPENVALPADSLGYSARSRGRHSPSDGGPGSAGPTTLTCAIRDRIVEKPIPLNGAQGPKAAIGYDRDFFVYEISIPLHESEVRNYGLAVAPGGLIGLHAEWGGKPERIKFERSGFGDISRPPADGLPPRGGRPGDRAMAESVKGDFSFKIALASDAASGQGNGTE